MAFNITIPTVCDISIFPIITHVKKIYRTPHAHSNITLRPTYREPETQQNARPFGTTMAELSLRFPIDAAASSLFVEHQYHYSNSMQI